MNSPSPRKRPLPSRLDHLKMQAAMPGTLNGDAARAELSQLDGPPLTPPTDLASAVAPPPAEPAPTSAAVAPPAPGIETELSLPTANPTSTARSRKPAAKVPETSPGIGGGNVRISVNHADELMTVRLHFQVVHKEKLYNQGIVADALDFYLAHLRRTGKLPPK